jgi:hypothetical protein
MKNQITEYPTTEPTNPTSPKDHSGPVRVGETVNYGSKTETISCVRASARTGVGVSVSMNRRRPPSTKTSKTPTLKNPVTKIFPLSSQSPQ